MERFQHRLARSTGNNLHDNNAKSMNNNNNLWVGRSVNSPSLYTNYNCETLRERPVAKTKSPSWWNDPERKRKRRVANYKFYAAEGKFKRCVKKGFRWLKVKCIKIVTNF
ncbi:unnamed protein product [Lathyrus sativus]|nr:unnamed protein product [Lathyrus sativus]